MKIEIRKNNVLIDGIKKEINEIFNYELGWYVKYPTWLDLRKNNKLKKENIEFINHSKRNYEIVGINDWHCTLKSNEKIVSLKGVMQYIS